MRREHNNGTRLGRASDRSTPTLRGCSCRSWGWDLFGASATEPDGFHERQHGRMTDGRAKADRVGCAATMGMMFGVDETLTCLVDVTLKGPNQEELCVAKKASLYFFVAGVWAKE